MITERWIVGLLAVVGLSARFLPSEELHLRLVQNLDDRFCFELTQLADGGAQYDAEFTWVQDRALRKVEQRGTISREECERLIEALDTETVWKMSSIRRRNWKTRFVPPHWRVEVAYQGRRNDLDIDMMGCTAYMQFGLVGGLMSLDCIAGRAYDECVDEAAKQGYDSNSIFWEDLR